MWLTVSVQVASIVHLLRGGVGVSGAGVAAGGSCDLLLVTPPATDPLAWSLSHIAGAGQAATDSTNETASAGVSGSSVVLTRSNLHTSQYAQLVRDVAAELHLPLVDLFALTDVQQHQPEQPNPYLCDGLHLSPAGNVLLYREILKCINQLLPHLAISRLPLDAPYHADVRPDNYRELFGDMDEQQADSNELQQPA